jgi:hypothetical protein
VAAVDVRVVTGPIQRTRFIGVPFRIFGKDPTWVPRLRQADRDRLSKRHPAQSHQVFQIWVAYRSGKPVGRIGACIDRTFNEFQGKAWGWVGFFDSFDDQEVADVLFGAACRWLQARDMTTAVGPASFTTNDEIGLQVDGFDDPPTIMTPQNPPYYERLWVEGGWTQTMDLWAWRFDKATTGLSERQRHTLSRLRERSKVYVRGMRMDDFDAEVIRFFEIYNAAWSKNWGFAPMPVEEIQHLGAQLKVILNPKWAFAIEREGEPIAMCLAVPDLNIPMRKIRSGRLLPTGWWTLLRGVKTVERARVMILGILPEDQNLAIGPLLYQEIVDRLGADPYVNQAEASWTVANNHRINNQLLAMGATRSKVWRVYERAL